jgi:hypothetical protein
MQKETQISGVTSRHERADLSHNRKAANKFFEMLEKVQNFGKTVTQRNCIYEEIRIGLNSGNFISI